MFGGGRLALTTGLGQWDVGGAKRAFLRRIDRSWSTDATEEGCSKIYLFSAAVDEYSNSNDEPTKFPYGTYCLLD